MPVWEQYDIEAVTEVKVRVRGELVSQFSVFANSKGGSNETIDRPLPQAVSAVVAQCQVEAERLAQAVRLNRREELGYRDGH